MWDTINAFFTDAGGYLSARFDAAVTYAAQGIDDLLVAWGWTELAEQRLVLATGTIVLAALLLLVVLVSARGRRAGRVTGKPLALEALTRRPRRFGYAAAAVFGIAFAVWGVNRRMGAWLIGAAALYSFTRVYAGVHYPLDIVASVLIAVVVTWLTFKGRDLLMPVLTLVMKAARILCLA